MSIRALNWAMKQATGDPRAQCLLYVVADAASPEGVAWPGADWMAAKSQQSRATVYRRLKQMQDMGLLVLFPRYMDGDGKIWTTAGSGRRQTSPEIRLQFDALVSENIIPENGEADESADTPVSASDTPVSQQRHPPSHCSDTNIPNSNQEKPTQPSQGRAVDEDSEKRFQAFKAGYPDGVIDLDAARREFGMLSRADQEACLAAVPVYAARCRARREKSMKGHLFVRKRAWDGLLAATGAEHSGATAGPYDRHSEVGRALVTLTRIARWRLAESNGGQLIYPRPITAQLLALAQAPEGGEVYPIGSKNFGAWRRLIDECLPNHGRLSEITAPWPYPPSATGKLYSGSDPPDDRVEGTLATKADLAEFSRGVCGP